MSAVAPIPVCVVVMTRDEAANLPHCLAPLTPFAEVFVVDSPGGDGTAAIAEAWGAAVVPFHWNGRLPRKKQWCLDHLPFAHDWVLFVDADEELTPALVSEIGRLMDAGPRHAGYWITGRPVFLGRALRFGMVNRKLALIDRRRAGFPDVDDGDVAAMWEVEGHFQPVMDGTTGRLRAPLWHHDRKPLAAWFERHNRYSDWEAALRADGRMARLVEREAGWRRWLKRLFGHLPLRPLAVFVYAYVLRLGFLDGHAGLHEAVRRGVYYWQIELKMLAARRSSTQAPIIPPANRHRGFRRPAP